MNWPHDQELYAQLPWRPLNGATDMPAETLKEVSDL